MNEKMLMCVSTENKLLLCYCDITNVEIKIMCFIRNNNVKKKTISRSEHDQRRWSGGLFRYVVL